MSHPAAALSCAPRLSDCLSVGLLAQHISRTSIDAALTATERHSVRERDLPAHVVVYYVLALALYMHVNTREVLRCVADGLRWLGEPARPLKIVTKSALSQARARLGAAPLQHLFDACARPLATASTRGAWYYRWRLVALDGCSLDVPDTPANRAAFGGARGHHGDSAFPQLRFAALVECGTHILFGARWAPYRSQEITLAKQIVGRLQPGMLCLADRMFLGAALWQQAQATGADLLWRARVNLTLGRDRQDLPDGSYLSKLYPTRADRKRRTNAIVIRVIEYRVTGIDEAEPFRRLVTTLLDPQQAPAAELAALYTERWEIEGALDEIKTHLRQPRLQLRSKTPELVQQEFYGLLLAHYSVRGLMVEAAHHADEDPDRLSFTHTVQVIRRRLPQFAAFPP